ncbi:hypothetical protein Tco_1146844 [Tanacetum coccineum]
MSVLVASFMIQVRSIETRFLQVAPYFGELRLVLQVNDEEDSPLKESVPGDAGSANVPSEPKKRKHDAPKRGASSLAPTGVGKHGRAIARPLGLEGVDDNDPYLPSVNEAHCSRNVIKHSEFRSEIGKLEDNLEKARNGQDIDGSQLVMNLRTENVNMLSDLTLERRTLESDKSSQHLLEEEVSRLHP